MPNKDWLKALDDAATIAQVIEVVDDFIDGRSDIYWSGIPEALRRPAIEDEGALQRWHHALVKAISTMPSPGSPMQELAVFSLRAAVRIHQIRLKDDPTSNDGGMQAVAAGLRGRL